MRFYFINLFFVTATYVLAPFFYFNSALNNIKSRKIFSQEKFNILVFQTPRIGDMVCATPVFREIKKIYPESKITVLGDKNALGILSGNPHIDETAEYEPFSFFSFFSALFSLRGKKFTHSINFFPSLSPNILPFWLGIPERICTKTESPKLSLIILSPFANRIRIYKKGEYAPGHHLKLLEFLNINDPDPRREIFSTEEAVEKAEKYFSALNLGGSEKLVGISLNCDKKFREWPKEKFVELIKMILSKKNAAVFLVGGERDKKEAESVISEIEKKDKVFNTSGVFKINELGAFLKKLGLFISVDTGPLYIADAVGTQTIDIIGPSDPATQSPQSKSIIVTSRHSVKSCSYIMYKSDCDKEQLEKLMDISPKEVFNAYENIVS